MAKRDFAQLHTPAKKQGGDRGPAAMIGVSLLFTAVLAFGGGYMVADTRHAEPALKAENAALKERIDALQKQAGELQQRLVASQQVKPVPAQHKDAVDRVGDLTFYSELPRQKVMPTPLGDTGPAARQKHHGEDIDAYAELPPPSPDSQRPGVVHPVDAARLEAAAHKSTAAPAQASTPSSGTGETAGSPDASYRLQAGSFLRRTDAEALLNRMLKVGIRGTVSEAQVPNLGTRYRVYTGSYTGMAQAEGARSLLRDKLGIDGLLMRE